MKFDVSDLVGQGLVRKKTYTDGPYKGLSVLKYHNKVFYDNLWYLDERLLECRGVVVDEDWSIIVRPFKKVFNLGENGTTVNPDRMVVVSEKVNGFMCAVTYNKNYGLIVSTTGSLDSSYVDLARKWVDTLSYAVYWEGYTMLFEICDKDDPHIVEQEEGIYLIGIRNIERGNLLPEWFLNGYNETLANSMRPRSFTKQFHELDTNVQHEGFMVSDYFTDEHLCKIKSPHYLSKKAIMRLGKGRVDGMFENPTLFKQRIDEEFYGVVDYIVKTFDNGVWKRYSDQQRRKVIEEYFMSDKTLVLVRGVSGSGKTTVAQMFKDAVCVAADDYFMFNGEYNFDPKDLQEAHVDCKERTLWHLKHNSDTVVVHNTFTQEWEMEPYFKIAEEVGAKVITLVVENRHGSKDVHDVPEEVRTRQESNLRKNLVLK